MNLDEIFLSRLLKQAESSQRLRTNQDLRTSSLDTSQRMLNALLPGTEVAIHRHSKTSETVICLTGRMDEVFFDEDGNETARIKLCPSEGRYGCQVPKGVWHTIEVYEPSVIFEAKDCAYGSDGSEMLDDVIKDKKSQSDTFDNSLGDLKKNIEYLIGMERHSGSMEVITPIYVSRMLNVSLADVDKAMKEMGL